MAVVTTNTPITADGWSLAASGAGEFHVTLNADGQYAYAASAPAGSLIGHGIKASEKLSVNLPAGTNLYVKVRPGAGGSVTLIVTPGQ